MTETSRLDLTTMTLPDVARLLSRASESTVEEAMLQADVAAGAPTNADGTLNLIHYAAWLVKDMGNAA